MTLTVKQIEAAHFAASKDRIADGNGLYLRVYRSGSKAFQLRAPIDGKPTWITLGPWPALSLKNARDLAGIVRHRTAHGASRDELSALLSGDDNKESVEDQAEDMRVPTFAEMARSWYARKKRGLRNPKHIQQSWNTVATYILPSFGHRPIDVITKADIVSVLQPIWHEKHETAARTLGRVREIFDLAEIEDHRRDNPARFNTQVAFGRVRTNAAHFGSMDPERVPEFWSWLASVPCDEITRQATMLLLLLLTAKCTIEVRRAKWNFFPKPWDLWITPAEQMKMGKEHVVPLSRQALRILENMTPLTGMRTHVFAKPRTKRGILSENTIRVLAQRFDPEITGHGFRASFRTWARAQRKYSTDVMEFALAHGQEPLEAAYMRSELLEERRILMQDWADYVTNGVAPERLLKAAEWGAAKWRCHDKLRVIG